MIITQEDFIAMESKANVFYAKNRIITSPIRGEVRLNPEGMEHLRKKNNKHHRDEQELYMRYLCLLSSKKLIEGMKFYQEYKSDVAFVRERKHGKTSLVKKMAEYRGMVGIIDTGKSKNRIRLVIRKIFGSSFVELYSVIPSRNSKGYSYYEYDLDKQKN